MSEALQHGQLRITWYPQVPCEAFNVLVKDVEQARLIYNTLALYDLFQLEHRIKPDFSNMGGLEVWDAAEQEWEMWENEDGDTLSDLLRNEQEEPR